MDQTKNELEVSKQDSLIIVDNLPSNINIFPAGSIILSNNIYFKDDFKGKTLNDRLWYVFEEVDGGITQNNQLNFASQALRYAHVYNKKPIRRDIDGIIRIEATGVRVEGNDTPLFELYRLGKPLEDTTPSTSSRILSVSLTTSQVNNKLQVHYLRSDSNHNSWDDVQNKWVAGSTRVSNFPFEENDRHLIQIEIKDKLFKIIIENITQNFQLETAPFHDIYGGNQPNFTDTLYPYLVDNSTTNKDMNVTWFNFSYQRLGG